jgi:uncharacterized membrane protein
MSLWSLLIVLVFMLVIFYVVTLIVDWMGLEPKANKLVRIITGLIMLLIFLGMMTGGVPVPKIVI